MTDDDRSGTTKPTRQERLQEQLRANLKRRKEQARARREPRREADVLPDQGLGPTEDNRPD